jgi:hypothetical protein
MTLADLLATLVDRQALKSGRAKDFKTSLRYLAGALGHASPEQCPVDDACREPDTWLAALESHFQTLTAQGKAISAETRRNTKNNLRVAFRLAESQGLLAAPLPVPLLKGRGRWAFQQQRTKTAPYQASYQPTTSPRRWGLPQREWPPEILAGWQDYQARCDGRLREMTFQKYAELLATYLGYVQHIVGREPRWDDCFDLTQLKAYVRWHASRQGRQISMQGRHVVRVLAAMAKVVDHDNAQALAEYRNGLPLPEPVHVKDLHWVSLAQLEAVAEACLHEGRAPVPVYQRTQHTGARRASQFQKGVMLKLLVRVPLRQRNVREMQLGLDKNLYQDRLTKHWNLRFQGRELKIGSRGGSVNKYEVDLTDYCPDLLLVLKEFLETYRRRLPGAADSQYLFLTHRGLPFSYQTLRIELADTVAMRTGQRFYPHLIRTIWATEYLTNPDTYGDYQGAATMLGDTVPVVIQSYSHLFKKEVYDRVSTRFLGKALKAQAPGTVPDTDTAGEVA